MSVIQLCMFDTEPRPPEQTGTQRKEIWAYRKDKTFKYKFDIKTNETNIEKIFNLAKREAKRLNKLRKHYGRNKISEVKYINDKRKVL